MIRRPEFWNKKLSIAILLLPLSLVWWIGSIVRQLVAKPYHARLPVICIGNLSVGGTGKTPAAILVVKLLKQAGWRPAMLTRGYGGKLSGPCWVESNRHTADDVGDEPLLLAQTLPVCVSRHRGNGARFIESDGAYDIIVMDDGLQNPSLHKDISIGLFDGGVGIGNGWMLPAGPMREAFSSGVQKLDLILINGADDTMLRSRLKSHLPADLPIFDVSITPDDTQIDLQTNQYIAFAGIGRPERFFQTLNEIGAHSLEQHAFPDHHPFRDSELVSLSKLAEQQNATLITTEKDWHRLPRPWQAKILYLPISLTLTTMADSKLADTITDRLNHVIS